MTGFYLRATLALNGLIISSTLSLGNIFTRAFIESRKADGFPEKDAC